MNNMIDIVILCAEKDLDTLELCITGIKKQIQNKINNIYIIGQNKNSIINKCNNLNINFINEDNFLEYNIDYIKNKMNNKQFAGWIFQQLLKLNIDTIPNILDNILIIDADKILIKPHLFINDNIVNFYIKYYNESKNNMINYLLGINKDNINCNINFINDMMLFNKNILKKLKNDIENNCQENWILSIINMINYTQNILDLSEYWLYGYYYTKIYEGKFNLINSNNLIFNKILSYDIYLDICDMDTIDLHSPLRYNNFKLT